VTTSSGGTHSLSTFSKPASTYDGDPIASSFLYPSSHVTVSLGRRVWNLRQPVYGFNGIVHGFVQLSRECTHVVRVEVSVETALFLYQHAQLIDVFGFAAPGESQGDFVRQRIDL
jgi:hypothetical protein